MSTRINIAALFKEGMDKSLAAQALEEEAKVGKALRAGNSGIWRDGTSIGSCHRKAIARFFGHHDKASDSRELMFESGRVNEDLWLNILNKVWDGMILREEDISTRWATQYGLDVTGRPDLVLCKRENANIVPAHVLELKQISSVWTARDVLIQNKPKLVHLAQAGHYMWQLNVNGSLCYTSRVDWPIVGWMVKNFIAGVQMYKEFFGLNPKGEPKKLMPFMKVYELEFKNGILYYKSEGTNWTRSIVTLEGIKRFYEETARMIKEEVLGKRPQNLDADGTEMGWKLCNQEYCPLFENCERNEGNFKNWTKELKK